MNIQDIDKYIIKSLEYFDNKNDEYNEFNKSQDIIINEKTREITIKSSFSKKELNGTFEVLGSFDIDTNTWFWSWVTPYLSIEITELSRDILNYGLKLEPESNALEHYFIKGTIINSRIKFQDEIQLEIFLSIICSIIKNKYDFLYKRIGEIGNKKIIVYYLITEDK